MLRIAVLYNQPQLPSDYPEAASEWEIVEIAQLVAEELNVSDWHAELWPANPDFSWVERLHIERPDVVFNLFEGFGYGDGSEIVAARYLEQFGIPYTGNLANTLQLARDKSLAYARLKEIGLLVPRSVRIDQIGDLPAALQQLPNTWPLFVKPACLDASIGIELENVIEDFQSLERRCRYLLDRYGPILIEEFLPGREFNISVIELGELQVLPISEIIFDCGPNYPWPIVSYAAKWQPGSSADRSTRPVCPADLDYHLQTKLRQLARTVFSAFGCRDYARIDVRLNKSGQPVVLEVNPNPGYHPEAGFSRSLQAAGWTHGEFSRALIKRALTRSSTTTH